MKKSISKAIYIKNVAVWVVISCCCIVAVGTFVKKFYEDVSAGNEIFLPGVIILVAAVLGLLVFSITRIIKYINRLR
jgi:membrane protein YdbS with pleckstrin-like domain